MDRGVRVQIRLHNTLTRRIEPFVPLTEGSVRMYTCGPTIYRPVHVGNLRSYLLADWLRRTFELFGHRVDSVKNITDVGHMRQDAVDRGEDKVIAAALAEGKTPIEIARHYEAAFREDERKLGILPATVYPRATEHVVEMVAVIERLLSRDPGLRGEAIRRLRPSFWQRERGAAPGRAIRGRPEQAQRGRLRALEACRAHARRARVELAVGARLSGLAHRVFGEIGRA